MTWTDGYISDVRYPAFFYKEMQPLWLSTLAGLQGFAAPDPHGTFTLCELGCGVGINLLVAAACHPQARFVGVDFNPDHLRMARDAATYSGIDNIAFVHADFATFAAGEAQQFDFITCHGVWSWIAPEYRAALLDCAARSLKPQGLFYLHYMCHPGSTELLPFQHLLNLCAHHLPGPSPRKAQTGMKLVQQLADGGLFADRPAMLRHLQNMAKRDAADLAHEFLTDHWTPQHSVDVHQQVAQAGLAFIASGDAFDNLDPSLSIPGGLQDLIRRTAAPALAETLKDMARNAHQRMDLFQKEPHVLTETVFAAWIAATRFTRLEDAPDRGPVTFATPIGPVTGPEAIFTPLLQRLAEGPATGAELQALPCFERDPGAILQSLQLLMMGQMVLPAGAPSDRAEERSARLSHWLAQNGIAITVIPACATAVTGTARA